MSRWIVLIVCLTACSTAPPPSATSCLATAPTAPPLALDRPRRLIFQTGFEANTQILRREAAFDKVTGKDLSVPEKGDWDADLVGHPNIGGTRIFYSDGDATQRKTTLVADPDSPANKVMEFRLIKANELHVIGASKGRIQLGISNNTQLRGLSYSVRIRLREGFDALSQYSGKISWMTLAEFWNNESNKAYPFRITLNLNKEKGANKPLFWGAHGQDKDDDGNWRDRWRVEVDDAPVPLDQWLTLSVSLAEGCKPHGWFRVVLTTANGAKHTLVDRRDLMQHPKDPRPNGVNAFNPMKLYTSKEFVDFVRDRGKNLVVLWDDFKLYDRATTQ
jgi:hypothetical protein